MRVCSTPGCGTIYPISEGSRCSECRRKADQARGNRGYNTKGHRTFRTQVLTRDPICVLCQTQFATVADHYPTSRRDLIDQGLNPNDPAYGRGLCTPCHNSETAQHQPGGFNTR